MERRDYRLDGNESESAKVLGLLDREWYKPNIVRSDLLRLMARTNTRATVDLVLWVALLLAAAWLLIITWISWWSIPAAVVYGVLYGSASDARWHEFGHRTALTSKRANDIVYHFASFMVIREPVSWRWSHVRHHAETIFVGRDPEIAFPRPTPRWKLFAEAFGLVSGAREFKKYLHALVGRIPADVASFVPQRERSRVIMWGRIHLGIHMTTICVCFGSQSVLPWMVIGLPSLYGRWFQFLLGLTQHAGLEEDVLDHRFNTRSVKMNPIVRFLYLDMNHHLEHHLFPAVPYHRLSELSRIIGPQLPPPAPSLTASLREVLRALASIRKQYATI